jgi:hypothetical protein
VPLANKKHEGNDLAASATSVRRKSKSWLPLGATGSGALVRNPDLADRE